jgi:hypothetical protein
MHVHRVPSTGAPAAVWRVAADRRRLASTPGLAFWKLLGTGRTFDPRDADPTTWALLAVWEHPGALADFERRSPVAGAWRRLAVERWRVDLACLQARGEWSRRAPFGEPASAEWDGPVAAVTRARLRLRRMAAFWRAVPPVTRDLPARAGLRYALGIGEAPVGVQGTFSVWASASDLRDFAYRGDAHRRVIHQTAEMGWYAEELFARFAVLQSTGTIAGRDPLEGAAHA